MPDTGPAYGRTRVSGGYLDRYMDGCTDSRVDYRTSSYTDSRPDFDTDGCADSHADDGCTDSRAYRRTSSSADSCADFGNDGCAARRPNRSRGRAGRGCVESRAKDGT